MTKIWSRMIAHPGVFVFMKWALDKLFESCRQDGVINDYAIVHSAPTRIDVAIKPTSKAHFYVYFIKP